MPTDVETLLRDHADTLEAAAPPITLDEVRDTVPPVPTPQPRDGRRDRRWLMVAAVLVLVSAGVVALALVDDRQGTVRTDDPTTITSPGTEPRPDDTTRQATTTAPAPIPVPPTEPAVTAGPPSTTVPVDVLTVEDVHARQVAALRALPGFQATSTARTEQTSPQEVADPRTAEFTMTADGSFYAQTGPDTWGSYDPATSVVRGVYRDLNGQLVHEEIVGQSDAFTPISILVGHNPTSLVWPSPEGEQTVEEVDYAGRPAWEIVTVNRWSNRGLPGISASDDEVVQTTRQIVDHQTGLIVAEHLTSTDPTTPDQESTLTNVSVTDELPAEFPGTFPDGAAVQRSGDPNQARSINPTDVDALFGIPVPLPADLESARLRFSDLEGYAEGDDVATGPSIRHRTLTITYGNSFVPIVVDIYADLLADGRDTSPDHRIVVDGYLCDDLQGDGVCDTYQSDGFNDGSTFTIEHGALAGNVGAVESGAVSVRTGALTIVIISEDTAAAVEIANSFRWPTENPPTNSDASNAYVVQAGDFPSSVAVRHCMTVQELIDVNGWTDAGSFPFPGAEIRVSADRCATPQAFYELQGDDDAASVAEQFCTTVANLYDINVWSEAEPFPPPGSSIIVPEGAC